MRKSWESHEKDMRKSWKSHEKVKKSHKKVMSNYWESHEKVMRNLWAIHTPIQPELQKVWNLRARFLNFWTPPPFLKRAIKSFSVDTHIFRGIINKIRKSLRWGTPISVKLFETIWTPNINKTSVNHSINQASNLRH